MNKIIVPSMINLEDIGRMILEVHISREVFYSLIIMLLLILFSLVIYFVFKKALKDPLKTPKGLVFIMYELYKKLDNFTADIMGERNRNFSFYIFAVAIYMFIGFTFGLTGLASPFVYIVIPLSISMWTFILIHVTAARNNKWGYFKRFIDPFPIFLPINLITMWSPLLSLTLRMFGNALSGYCIMSLMYAALEGLSGDIFRPIFTLGPGGGTTGADIFLAPIITPIFHVYFDLISALIQTMVFTMLTMIFISQEQVEDVDEKIIENISLNNKEAVL